MTNEYNRKTVKWVLLSLNLDSYTHVYIRQRGAHQVLPLGGGYPDKVIREFGDCLVMDSCIYEGGLCLYVVPDGKGVL